MRVRTTNQRPKPPATIRLAIWTCIILVGTGLWFDAHPVVLDVPEDETSPTELPERRRGETLLVFSSAHLKAQNSPGHTFTQTDWSAAWLNPAEQEIGPHAVLDISQVKTTDLTPYRVVILTHSALAGAEADDDALVKQLEAYASLGGVLVLERPSAKVRDRFSADGQGGERVPRKVTTALGSDGKPVAGLDSMPLLTTYIGSGSPARDAETLLAFDDVPVIYRLSLGRGAAITIEFDVGRQLLATQQGVPEANFEVKNRHTSRTSSALQPSDLVASETLLKGELPYADMLERYLVYHVIAGSAPLVTVWPFPRLNQGAVLLTHHQDGMTAEGAWMASAAQKEGNTSTYFLRADDNMEESARALAKLNASVQLTWCKPESSGRLEDFAGLGSFQPVARPRPLRAQVETLKKVFPRKSTIINRNRDLLWTDTYTGTFRQLAGVSIHADSTYGATGNLSGYLFGTGMPFRPLDTNGLPFRLLEFPVIVDGVQAGADPAFVQNLIKQSRDEHHQVITMRFDAHAFRLYPSTRVYDAWKGSMQAARAYDHWLGTLAEYDAFWAQRTQLTLKTRVRLGTTAAIPVEDPVLDPNEVAPKDLTKVTTETLPAPIAPIILELDAESPRSDMTLTVPVEIDGRAFFEARTGPPGASHDLTTVVQTSSSTILGKGVRLVPLRKGANAITVTYR